MQHLRYLLVVLPTLVAGVHGQAVSSWPQDYPGIPTGDYGPEWQECLSHLSSLRLMVADSGLECYLDFQVTSAMPNVTFPLGRNWAGNIPVNRPGHPNNTLFFWGFEKENGSLTAGADERQDEPWGIWLNGGHVFIYLVDADKPTLTDPDVI